MEGIVGRRGCKPGVAIGGEMRAMLDMDFVKHSFHAVGWIAASGWSGRFWTADGK
jgi:hypothetical protein